jgi:T3SS negative regulator,GrlR
MQNGLYKVIFETPLGAGYGVVNLLNGSISGGDSSMYYFGTYELSGTNFTAFVQVKQHSNVAGLTSVFGVAEAEIQLNGQSTDTTAQVVGSSPQAPQLRFSASLAKLV